MLFLMLGGFVAQHVLGGFVSRCQRPKVPHRLRDFGCRPFGIERSVARETNGNHVPKPETNWMFPQSQAYDKHLKCHIGTTL